MPLACAKCCNWLNSKWLPQDAGAAIHSFSTVSVESEKGRLSLVKGEVLSSPNRADSGSILQPINELEPGPNVIDSANLYIDQACCQTDCPNICLRQIGNHARALLWPRDPKHSRRG